MTSTFTTQKLRCNRRVKRLAKTSAAFLAQRSVVVLEAKNTENAS
jgi:hypothetical protein